MTPDEALWLGRSRDDESAVTLPRTALLRHMMALGSSGSGKTVLSKVVVEECLRSGVPAICIDPQGDICSLLERPDPAALAEHGIEPEVARTLHERIDVVIWTPGAAVGVPLCADPVNLDASRLGPDERSRALSRVAANVTSLLGYELGSDDGDGLCAALDHACAARLEQGRELSSLRDVADELSHRESDGFVELQRFLGARKLKQAVQRLARLDVGARRNLFHDGHGIDVDKLLGRDETAVPGKTRVSVIYLNALEQQEDKELVVAILADQLYRWMLDHPAQALQALFYIDEVAPFIPPVRKPSCKQGLSLLFKQARKYGLGCLMATQNPGDVDYKAMAQFGTWAVGRLTTRQDRKKVEPTIASLADARADAVMDELPRLKAGQFVLLSPDHLEAPAPLACRWLLTAHETFDEARIRAAADRLWRTRFATAEGSPVHREDPPPMPPPSESPVAEAAVAPSREPAPSSRKATSVEPVPSSVPESLPPLDVEPAVRKTVLSEPAEAGWLEHLRQAGAVDAKQFGARMDVSAGTARRRAKQLVAQGLAATFQRGRSTLFWAVSSGLRPDLDLLHPVAVAAGPLQQGQVQGLAERHRRTPMLGVLGTRERLARLDLLHLPLVHVPFDEQVERSLLERALGPRHDQLHGSVYLHPRDLRYLVLDPSRGVSFATRPADYASRVQDLDGAVNWQQLAPASLQLDEALWSSRRALEEATARVRQDYPTTRLGAASYVFMPYWHLVFEQDGGSNYRVLDLDPVIGQPFEV